MKNTWLVEDRRESFRTRRLRLAWLLAVPFLFFSTPTPGTLLTGGWVSLSGLVVRALAAGSIHKERELATAGPYRIIRHPLYVGSFLVGFGLAMASGRWWMLLTFVALFFWLYGNTVRAEERKLEALFGRAYEGYRMRVPAFLPQVRGRQVETDGPGFRPWLYWRNKEWQAAAGTLVGYGLLWARMWLLG